MQNICAIVAIGENNEIGFENSLLWHLPDDFKWFKRHTLGCPVIMGRKTFESIGKPLPGRLNIVISSKSIPQEGIKLVQSIEQALQIAQTQSKDIFVIGGQMVYKEFENYYNKLIITRVLGSFKADAFWQIPLEAYNLTYSLFHPHDDKHKYGMEFCIYQKR
jgi:dihydrofolate reductase